MTKKTKAPPICPLCRNSRHTCVVAGKVVPYYVIPVEEKRFFTVSPCRCIYGNMPSLADEPTTEEGT